MGKLSFDELIKDGLDEYVLSLIIAIMVFVSWFSIRTVIELCCDADNYIVRRITIWFNFLQLFISA